MLSFTTVLYANEHLHLPLLAVSETFTSFSITCIFMFPASTYAQKCLHPSSIAQSVMLWSMPYETFSKYVTVMHPRLVISLLDDAA